MNSGAVTRSIRRGWALRGAASLLALAVFEVVASTEARAGCSHPWLSHRGRAEAVDLARLSPFELGDATRRDESPTPSKPRTPCASGLCSPIPVLPPVPPTFGSTRADLWGHLAPPLVLSGPGGLARMAVE